MPRAATAPATATTASNSAPWLAEETVDQVDKENKSSRYVAPSKLAPDVEHRYRMFGTGITGFETWTQDNKPVRFQMKPAMEDLPSNVKLNDDGVPQVKRFIAGVVWDEEAEEFKILQISQKSLMGDLFKYMKDKDYGNPVNYDIKITRTGSGLGTEYSLVPAPPKAADPEVVAKFEELYCNLEALFEGKDPFEKSRG